MPRVQVAIRLRPLSCNENSVEYSTDDQHLHVVESNTSHFRNAYRFDHVFDSNVEQNELHDEMMGDLLQSCLEGVNGTTMAYGPTGCGKTYTMMGTANEQGILPRSVRELRDYFSVLEKSCGEKYFLRFSAVELYRDTLYDLLNDRECLKMAEKNGADVVVGLIKKRLSERDDFQKLLDIIASHRITARTSLNDVSSRSHAIFYVEVCHRVSPQANMVKTPQLSRHAQSEPTLTKMLHAAALPNWSTPPDTDRVVSTLTFVDLAGSERVKMSKASGQTMLEAQSINQSLSALASVIRAIHSGNHHVPYRNSKLTRLLRGTLENPRSTIVLITNISMASQRSAEACVALRFADSVKQLQTVTAIDTPVCVRNHLLEGEYRSVAWEWESLCSEMRIAREYKEMLHPPSCTETEYEHVFETQVQTLRAEERKKVEGVLEDLMGVENSIAVCRMDLDRTIHTLEDAPANQEMVQVMEELQTLRRDLLTESRLISKESLQLMRSQFSAILYRYLHTLHENLSMMNELNFLKKCEAITRANPYRRSQSFRQHDSLKSKNVPLHDFKLRRTLSHDVPRRSSNNEQPAPLRIELRAATDHEGDLLRDRTVCQAPDRFANVRNVIITRAVSSIKKDTSGPTPLTSAQHASPVNPVRVWRGCEIHPNRVIPCKRSCDDSSVVPSMNDTEVIQHADHNPRLGYGSVVNSADEPSRAYIIDCLHKGTGIYLLAQKGGDDILTSRPFGNSTQSVFSKLWLSRDCKSLICSRTCVDLGQSRLVRYSLEKLNEISLMELNSFSLRFHTEQCEDPTMYVTFRCLNLLEYEAWIEGICHITHQTPVWSDSDATNLLSASRIPPCSKCTSVRKLDSRNLEWLFLYIRMELNLVPKIHKWIEDCGNTIVWNNFRSFCSDMNVDIYRCNEIFRFLVNHSEVPKTLRDEVEVGFRETFLKV